MNETKKYQCDGGSVPCPWGGWTSTRENPDVLTRRCVECRKGQCRVLPPGFGQDRQGRAYQRDIVDTMWGDD